MQFSIRRTVHADDSGHGAKNNFNDLMIPFSPNASANELVPHPAHYGVEALAREGVKSEQGADFGMGQASKVSIG